MSTVATSQLTQPREVERLVAGQPTSDGAGVKLNRVTALSDVDLIANAESAELRWVPVGEVSALHLHPGFARTWPSVRTYLLNDPVP